MGRDIPRSGQTTGGTEFYTHVWPVWKKPVRLATTSNIASLVAGTPLVVDGVTVSVGDRILVSGQSSDVENGIYRVMVAGTGSDGAWTRDSDCDSSSEILGGMMVYVQEGTQNGRTRFTLVTTGAITLGVSSLIFIQEAPLVRTDATSTEILPAIAFTNGTILWSNAIDTRDYSEVSVWFAPSSLGGNTQVDIYVQWSDDGTISFSDTVGIQQTDFLIAGGTDGTFKPKNYVARLTTSTGELAAGTTKLLSFPKKGGLMRVGVMGNDATGQFSLRALRLA